VRRSSEYKAWDSMKQRCNNYNHPAYKNYGGRGIKVSPEFDTFEGFLSEVGRKPGPEYTLDRINNDGNYEPGNVRWATRITQNQNRSNSKLTWDDIYEIREMCKWFDDSAIALEFGVTRNMINRIRHNKRWVE
jgi:hypothetical protein